LSAFFFDSSALAKCYIQEIGSDWVRQLAEPAADNDIHVLCVAQVEVASAVVRRKKSGEISPPDAVVVLAQLRHDFANEFLALDLSEQLLSSAVSLVEKYELPAYDGIQLVGSVELNRVRIAAALPAAVLVSSDQELNAAALAEGLVVEDPNTHP
jgi:hypothetical protein